MSIKHKIRIKKLGKKVKIFKGKINYTVKICYSITITTVINMNYLAFNYYYFKYRQN